jgi:hypothetical protein
MPPSYDNYHVYILLTSNLLKIFAPPYDVMLHRENTAFMHGVSGEAVTDNQQAVILQL